MRWSMVLDRRSWLRLLITWLSSHHEIFTFKHLSVFSHFVCSRPLLSMDMYLTPDLTQRLFLSLSHPGSVSHGCITRLTCSPVLHRRGERCRTKTENRLKLNVNGLLLLLLLLLWIIAERESDMRPVWTDQTNSSMCPSLKRLQFGLLQSVQFFN